MKAGRVLIALMFALGLIGVFVNGAPLYSRFLYTSILLAFVSWAWTVWVANRISLERSTRELRANVGDVFEENYKILNQSNLPASWIEVINQSKIPFAAGSRLLTLVLANQKRTYNARTWLTQRGSFELGPTAINIGDPFGIFTTKKIFPAQETLIVFPMIQEIEYFPSSPGLLPGGHVIQRKSHDITPHAAGVRDYIHGDAMKRIHWRTSIRRDKLMVKEFEQDPQAEVWIYLDSQKDVHYQKEQVFDESPMQTVLFVRRPKIKLPPSTLEYSVSIAASLAHYFIRQRRAVGYASAGQTYTILPADRSERQEAKILETLAFVQANGELSIAGLVSTQAMQLPKRSTVILITPTVRTELLQAVDDLLLRSLYPIIVLLDAQTFGGPTGTDKIINSLREKHVPICNIACDDDLATALSNLRSTFKTQDFRSWQTPVSSA
ncbi:MAG TPA: hypothetical protein DHW49_03015 [Anaerolineae bacterium]|mgnify:FL=1|nr:hypothetical protein [Anaerolineae bacterium]